MFLPPENTPTTLSTNHHDVMHQVVHAPDRPDAAPVMKPGAEAPETVAQNRITLDQVITAYGAFAQHIDQLIDKIPNGIPILSTLKEMAKGKAALLKSSFALSLGFDVDRQQFVDNWQERLQLVGSHLTSSLLSDVQALFEILTLATGAGTLVSAEAAAGGAGAQSTLKFVEFLGGLKNKNAAKKVVSLLPDALSNLIPQIKGADLQGTLANLTHAIQILVSNEKISDAAATKLESQVWWQQLQQKLVEGQMNVDSFKQAVDEVDAQVRAQMSEEAAITSPSS